MKHHVYYYNRIKKKLGKHLDLAEKEEIYVTRNGKVVAKLSNQYQDRVDALESLVGIIPSFNLVLEETKNERLAKL